MTRTRKSVAIRAGVMRLFFPRTYGIPRSASSRGRVQAMTPTAMTAARAHEAPTGPTQFAPGSRPVRRRRRRKRVRIARVRREREDEEERRGPHEEGRDLATARERRRGACSRGGGTEPRVARPPRERTRRPDGRSAFEAQRAGTPCVPCPTRIRSRIEGRQLPIGRSDPMAVRGGGLRRTRKRFGIAPGSA